MREKFRFSNSNSMRKKKWWEEIHNKRFLFIIFYYEVTWTLYKVEGIIMASCLRCGYDKDKSKEFVCACAWGGCGRGAFEFLVQPSRSKFGAPTSPPAPELPSRLHPYSFLLFFHVTLLRIHSKIPERGPYSLRGLWIAVERVVVVASYSCRLHGTKEDLTMTSWLGGWEGGQLD